MPTQRDLYKLIAEHFSIAELEELTYDLEDVSFEDIAGSTRRSKALNLQTYMTRRGRLDELMAAVAKSRDFLDLTPYGYQPEGDSEPAGGIDLPSVDTGAVLPDVMEYENFDLRVAGPYGEEYLVEVLYSPFGQVMPISRQFPLDDYEFADLVSYLSDLVGRAEDAVDLGEKMRGLLFPNDIWSKFVQCRTDMKTKGKGLRLRLRIDPPELGNLPWEYCYDSTFDFLAQDRLTPMVRYPPEPLEAGDLETDYPVKILLVMANPEDPDLAKLDLDKEVAIVQDALEPLKALGYAEIDVLERATVPEMRRALRDGGYHVLHFLGHGIVKNDEGALALEDGNHALKAVFASQLRAMLRSTSVKVIFLNSCETAAYKKGLDPITSVGLSLIRAGIPTVMAMQFKVPDDTARLFSRELYSSLVQGKPLDLAVTEMRQAAYIDEGDMVYWGIPVLFMRSENGVIWQPNAEVAARLASYKPQPKGKSHIKALIADVRQQVEAVKDELDAGDVSDVVDDLDDIKEIVAAESPNVERLKRKIDNIKEILAIYGPAVSDPILPKLEEVAQLADAL